jgi:prepilin-type processing-associated H-X9-DG protein
MPNSQGRFATDGQGTSALTPVALAWWVHAYRIVSRHCNHRHPGGFVTSSAVARKGVGPPDCVRRQSSSTRSGVEHIRGQQTESIPIGHWDHAILPSIDLSNKVYMCPDLGPPSFPLPIPLGYNPSYGYNLLGTGYGMPLTWNEEHSACNTEWTVLPESKLAVASELVAIGDVVELGAEDGDIACNFKEPDDWIANRHRKGGNVVFCDVHVEYDKQVNWDDGRRASSEKMES